MIHTSLSTLASFLGMSCPSNQFVSEFSIDSRYICVKGMFFAIRGKKVDGHSFLHEVAKRGAICAVVEERYAGNSYGLELFRVPDVREALHTLAREVFRKRKEKVIAITGSMGKTTTKEFLAKILSTRYRIAKTHGNENTQLTHPLTVLNLKGNYDYLVLEMGMNQHGEIQRLVEITPPDIAMVTRIAPAGIEDFQGGLAAVARAKGEIFSSKHTRYGVISSQVAEFSSLLYRGNCQKVIYGMLKDRKWDFSLDEKGCVIERDGSRGPPLSFQMEGEHLRENFLGAVAVARVLGLSWNEISQVSGELKPYERRFVKIVHRGITFIDDSYNANPVSVRIAMENLPKPKEGRNVIGVVGSMPDLGEASEGFHEELGRCAKQYLDHLICIGDDAEAAARAFCPALKKAQTCESLSDISKVLRELVEEGDVVLLKGGNRHQLWQLLEEK